LSTPRGAGLNEAGGLLTEALASTTQDLNAEKLKTFRGSLICTVVSIRFMVTHEK
jgi:hypothetical protein